ncbi:unnamed protein product, partial [marine sediment metagenome]
MPAGDARMDIFAYGTLMLKEIMERASGEGCTGRRALLPGYERRAVRGEVYPGIVARPGGEVDGVVYTGLSARAVERLDRFEGEPYLRSEVLVRCEDGVEIQAWAYVVKPEHEEMLAGEGWSFEDFLRNGRSQF